MKGGMHLNFFKKFLSLCCHETSRVTSGKSFDTPAHLTHACEMGIISSRIKRDFENILNGLSPQTERQSSIRVSSLISFYNGQHWTNYVSNKPGFQTVSEFNSVGIQQRANVLYWKIRIFWFSQYKHENICLCRLAAAVQTLCIVTSWEFSDC